MATLNSIAKALCLANPQLRRVGRWLFFEPVQHILIGLLLDGSGDRRIVRPTSVVTPLYKMGHELGFGFGERWSGRYEFGDPNIEIKLLDGFNLWVTPLLPLSLSIQNLLDLNIKESDSLQKIAHQDPIFRACTAAAHGEFKCALKIVEETLTHMEKLQFRGNLVQHPLQPDLKKVRNILSNNPKEIGDVMRDFELSKMKKANLEKYWQPSPFPFELAGKT